VSLLLHAITPIEPAAPSLAGLRGQPVIAVDEQGLTAWTTDFDEAPGQLTRDDLLAHHGLISQLHESLASVVPARFPTWVADAHALRRLIGSRRGELSSALDTVRGCAELSVTAVWLTDDDDAASVPEAATPGRRYLLERRQAFAGSDRRRQRAREVADQIERLVGPDLVESQRRVCPSTAVAASMALLVPRLRAVEIMARLPPVESGVRILVNGPWPPYSFVDIG
jgi:hypothetical protein